MKNVFSIAIAAPILAMFVDIGAPTYRISGTWDQRNTDTLISGVMTTYSIGGVLISLQKKKKLEIIRQADVLRT